jgi:hypothetical protein
VIGQQISATDRQKGQLVNELFGFVCGKTAIVEADG